jgi:hypothetical protein
MDADTDPREPETGTYDSSGGESPWSMWLRQRSAQGSRSPLAFGALVSRRIAFSLGKADRGGDARGSFIFALTCSVPCLLNSLPG